MYIGKEIGEWGMRWREMVREVVGESKSRGERIKRLEEYIERNITRGSRGGKEYRNINKGMYYYLIDKIGEIETVGGIKREEIYYIRRIMGIEGRMIVEGNILEGSRFRDWLEVYREIGIISEVIYKEVRKEGRWWKVGIGRGIIEEIVGGRQDIVECIKDSGIVLEKKDGDYYWISKKLIKIAKEMEHEVIEGYKIGKIYKEYKKREKWIIRDIYRGRG